MSTLCRLKHNGNTPAGTTTAFNNEKNIPTKDQCLKEPCPNLDEVGWYSLNSGVFDSSLRWTGQGDPFSVGQKKPNNWGLYDMHGNVWEWCLDWSGDYLASSVTDPTGPATGSKRVERGGSFLNFPPHCRSAYRVGNTPDGRGSILGFRLALSFNFTVSEYRRLAEQGDADAQNKLAFCYYEGEGVEKDLKEALKWWTKAAEQGLAKAQNNLGEMYLYGEGTEKDLDQARKWFRKAANQGHAEAKKNLERLKD